MAILSKQPISDRIVNAPKLMYGSEHYFEAYVDLSTEDRMSWSKIVQYGQYYDFDYETIENLLYVLPRAWYDFHERIKPKEQS